MINEIKLDDNSIITNQAEILDELKDFYQKLYSRKIIDEDDGDDLRLTPKLFLKKKNLN